MAKKINLDIASVEQREQRLGTIIAWDGTTEELHKQSGYELRGQRERGAGCGGNCRLCELSGRLRRARSAVSRWWNARRAMSAMRC
jgi:nitrogenase molybdenum-iron protein alpha chain